MSEIPEPFPLRNIPVPRDVTAVRGCDCGGMDWHRVDRSLWHLPVEDQRAAVEAAEDSLTRYTDALNAKMRAADARTVVAPS